jgi:hypothetical protein
MGIMRPIRKFLRISTHANPDGEPIANVDFGQLFPTLAYHREGLSVPDGDLYDVIGGGLRREGWKKLTNALLFADGPMTRWPEGTSSLFGKGTKLRDALGIVKHFHAPIAHLFGTGIGFKLMLMESEILIQALGGLAQRGITALPLHDSVLVAAPAGAPSFVNSMEAPGIGRPVRSRTNISMVRRFVGSAITTHKFESRRRQSCSPHKVARSCRRDTERPGAHKLNEGAVWYQSEKYIGLCPHAAEFPVFDPYSAEISNIEMRLGRRILAPFLPITTSPRGLPEAAKPTRAPWATSPELSRTRIVTSRIVVEAGCGAGTRAIVVRLVSRKCGDHRPRKYSAKITPVRRLVKASLRCPAVTICPKPSIGGHAAS